MKRFVLCLLFFLLTLSLCTSVFATGTCVPYGPLVLMDTSGGSQQPNQGQAKLVSILSCTADSSGNFGTFLIPGTADRLLGWYSFNVKTAPSTTMSVVSQPGTDIPSVTVNTTGVQPTNSMTVLVKDIFGVPIDGAKMTSNISNSAPAEYTIYRERTIPRFSSEAFIRPYRETR